jgi:hypothetical protein
MTCSITIPASVLPNTREIRHATAYGGKKKLSDRCRPLGIVGEVR